MVEVTRTNFKNIFPEIALCIKRCQFIAIDGEFSGLASNVNNEISVFDTPEQYYHKMRSGSLDFLFFQFGMSAFRYNKDKNIYSHRDYNFYVFPRPVKKGPDCRYLSQSTSMTFLASNNFDFNKVVYDGIPYLNIPEERALRRNLSAKRTRHNPSDTMDAIDNPESEEEHDDGENWRFFTNNGIYEDEEEDLVIEAKRTSRPLTGQKLEDAIEEAVGFSAVIRLIAESGKLVVGHNMMLDLCHMSHRFHTPLPHSRDYAGFKRLLHSVFPNVLDTKLLCSCEPLADVLPSSALPRVLAAVQSAPFSIPPIEPELPRQCYTLSSAKQHEAGYDAYVTGLVAVALSEYLRVYDGCATSDRLPSADSPHLRGYINNLHQFKSEDYYIDLEGDDPPGPDRCGVFHVTFPERWSPSQLTDVFEPFGGLGRGELIAPGSAYCEIEDASRAGEVLQLPPPPGVEIVSYEEHRGRPGGCLDESAKRRHDSDSEDEDGSRKGSKQFKSDLPTYIS